MEQLDLLSPFLGQNWHFSEERFGLTFRYTGPGQVASVIWGRGLRNGDELVVEIPAFSRHRVGGNLRLVVDGVLQSYVAHDVGRHVELRSSLEGLSSVQSRSSILFVLNHLEMEGSARLTGLAVSRIFVNQPDQVTAKPRGIDEDLQARWLVSTPRKGESLEWTFDRQSVRVDGVVQQTTLSGVVPLGYSGRLYRSTRKLTFEFTWPATKHERLVVQLGDEGMDLLEAGGDLGRLPTIAVSELIASVARLVRGAHAGGPQGADGLVQLNDLAVELFRHAAAVSTSPSADAQLLRVPGALAKRKPSESRAGQVEWVSTEEKPETRYFHINIAVMHEAGRIHFLTQYHAGRFFLRILEDPWPAYRLNAITLPLPVSIDRQSSEEDQRRIWSSFSPDTRASICRALQSPHVRDELVGKLGQQNPSDWLALISVVSQWLTELDQFQEPE